MGWSGRAGRGSDFAAAEPALASEWATRRGTSSLDWPQARPATRAAWDRADETDYGKQANGSDIVNHEDLSNDDVVDVLNDLLENARDGEYGFRTCAEQVETTSAKQLFASRAEGCRQAGGELIQLIRAYGGEPASGGTTAGAMHRGWVRVKGSVGAGSELSILESCQRGDFALSQGAQSESALRRPAYGAEAGGLRPEESQPDPRHEECRAGTQLNAFFKRGPFRGSYF